MEWDYGAYEGRTTRDPRGPAGLDALAGRRAATARRSSRSGQRVDRVLDELHRRRRRVLFAHGHVLRVLTARWLGLEPDVVASFALDPATLSTLGYERETPVIQLWNEAVGG